MKFSNSLKFNAVAEWWEDYIAYSALKKHIYVLEKEAHSWRRSSVDLESGEHRRLISQRNQSADAAFEGLLDRELKKIALFYQIQESELLRDLQALGELIRQKDEEGLILAAPYRDDDDEEEEDDDEDDDDDDEGPRFSDPSGQQTSGRKSPKRRQGSPRFSTVPVGGRSRHARRSSAASASSDEHADLEASLDTLKRTASVERPSIPRRRRQSSLIAPLGTIFQNLLPGGSVESANLGGSVWTSRHSYATDVQLLFKRRIINLYIQFTSLKSYVELNYSGFRKILKKYDKVLDSDLKNYYMHNVVERAHPFLQESRDRLSLSISKLVEYYTKCVTKGDNATAIRQLRVHLREQIAWERDTVWRQMIGKERRGDSDGHPKALGVISEDSLKSEDLVNVATPVGRIRLPRRTVFLVISIAVFITLLNVQILEGLEANRCLAILLFATLLWATEAIPLFVTSMLVPLLVVCLRVVRTKVDDGYERLETPQATKYIFSVMFSPTIMLLIGGFTIASALSKTNIDRLLITKVLSLAGTRPSIVLLCFMGVACFASMWISNVAAPTLCFTLIRPILRTLPPKSSFGPCIILAIALAANIGGQSSPISSPQNLIALDEMDEPLDWAQWFIVSLPVGVVSIVLIWLLLLASYKPGTTLDGEQLVIKPIRPMKDKFTKEQYWVSLVCIVTIALWCFEHSIEDYVGDMGIIAIIPIVAFFSTGVLKKEDFEQFLWTVVFLAMGGIALGKAVTSSGLLDVMGGWIRGLVSGLSLYTVVLVLSCVVLVISTFISHTIASVLLVPIAAEVGANLENPHPRLLIFITGLVCSTGMGMPVSGFPNQTASTQEDEFGQLYLSNVDFLKNGVPASIISTFVVATVGFVLMKAIGV